MLTIIALVHRIEAELPHERVKLYDKCVTTLVETWDKVRGIKTTRAAGSRKTSLLDAQPAREKGWAPEAAMGICACN